MASPVFKTGVTRPSRVGWVRFPHSPAIARAFRCLIVAAFAAFVATPARAQQVETPVIRPDSPPTCIPLKPDTTTRRPPTVVIAGQVEKPLPKCRKVPSPRRAFLMSFLVPGLAQTKLDRRRVAMMFASAELGSIGMSIKSKHDLSVAVSARRDTISVPLVDSITNVPVIDPETGLQKTESKPRNQNIADRIKARRTHLEDWIAAIVFNHLFSGADAYVAANLADFDTNVSVSATGRGVRVVARAYW